MARKTSPKARGVTFDTARAIALALEGVEESTSYGTPAFKRKGKLMVRLREDGTLAVRADHDARDLLVASEPETFFFTEHYAAHPWVLVRLPSVSRDALTILMEEAWRSVGSAKQSREAPREAKVTPRAKAKPKAVPARDREHGLAGAGEALAWMRELCSAWPGVTEELNHGHASFVVRGKTFAMFLNNHHGDGRVAVWCKAPPGAQGVLVGVGSGAVLRAAVPRAPGVGRGEDGEGGQGGAVAACVEEAYRMTGPKRGR